jgi:hypothetical protein
MKRVVKKISKIFFFTFTIPFSIASAQTTDNMDRIRSYLQGDVITIGKENTEKMLLIVFIFLVLLLVLGYVIQSKKSKNLNFILPFILFALSPLIALQTIHAICPVCTVAVGAGLGLSRYFGIDDLITSLWIGGIIVSTIFWIIDWLGKRNKKSTKINILTTIITYALVLIPLYFSGIIGNQYNTYLNIDKVLFGTIIGSIAFTIGAQLHFLLKQKNGNKVFIPFQKVIIPVGALWLISLLLYFVIYYF